MRSRRVGFWAREKLVDSGAVGMGSYCLVVTFGRCGMLPPTRFTSADRFPALPVAAARPISLTASQRHRLTKMAYGHKTPHQARMHAQVVLHAARGRSNARIARETGLHLDTLRTWRGRFAEQGLPGLADRRRSGRPPVFTALHAAQVTALACQLPAETGTPPPLPYSRHEFLGCRGTTRPVLAESSWRSWVLSW